MSYQSFGARLSRPRSPWQEENRKVLRLAAGLRTGLLRPSPAILEMPSLWCDPVPRRLTAPRDSQSSNPMVAPAGAPSRSDRNSNFTTARVPPSSQSQRQPVRVDLELCVRERVLEPPRVGRASDDLEVDLSVDIGRSSVNGAALRAEKSGTSPPRSTNAGRLPVVVRVRAPPRPQHEPLWCGSILQAWVSSTS